MIADTTAPRTTQEFARDAADERALRDYVDGLPNAERVAYIRANPAYMVGDYPAYLLHDAAQLAAQGRDAEGRKLLADHWQAQCVARVAAQAARNAPPLGDRVANSIVQAAGVGMLTTFGVLGAGAMGAHYAMAGILSVGLALGSVAAIGGFISGGK